MRSQPIHVREEETSRRSQRQLLCTSLVLTSAMLLTSLALMLALQLAGQPTDPIWPGPVNLHGALQLALACVV